MQYQYYYGAVVLLKKAVAYCRVSKDNDEQLLNSLKNQKEYFKEEIVKRGFELTVDCGIDGIYADEGITGTSLKKRDSFNRMIDDAKEGKFNYVFCKQISRFARNVEDTKKKIRELKEVDVGVYFVTENIDSLNSQHDFMISMFAAVAQEEARQTSDRVKFGLRKLAKSGMWKSTPPFGYSKKDKKLIINEQEVEVVREIFQKYYFGWGIGKITRYLNGNDIPTKNTNSNKKVSWSQITVSSILKNPIYKGLICQHKTEMIDPIAKIKRNVPENEWIENQDENIRIIENDLFNLVQEEIKKRNELFGNVKVTMSKPDEDGNRVREKTEVIGRNGRYSNKHLFSNLLYCKNCGVAMKRKKRNAYRRKDGSSNTDQLGYEWVCTYQDLYGKKKCNTLWRNKVTEKYLISSIKEQIKSLLSERCSELDTYFMYYLKFKLGDNLIEKLPGIEREINEINQLITDNIRLLSKKIITEEQFESIAIPENKRLEELKKEKDTILNLDRERKKVELKQKELKEFIANSDLDNFTNEFLRKIIKKIYIEVNHDLLRYDDDDEKVIIMPIYDFGIDITFNEIDRFTEQWVKEDSRKEAREKRMHKGKIFKIIRGNVRNYKKHKIIACDGLRILIDDEGEIPRPEK